jgi:hypothetical protein
MSTARRVAQTIRRRIAQHHENLAGWTEPERSGRVSTLGWLIPSEPDPDERRKIRRDLTVAIAECEAILSELE